VNDLLASRLTSQLLSGPTARSPEAVVDRLLALQAQDARGARLGVRSRSSGLVAADVDHSLSVTRSLVVSWLNRGTLHLVAAEDYWWLHPLTTPQLVVANERRLRQEGVSPTQADRGVAVIVDALTSDGPRTRAQLRERLDEAGVPTAGQALVQVLVAASLHGQVVRGPQIGREHAYVSAPAWLGAQPAALDRDDALARLARRYLAGHGPAGPSDLAKWAGITVRDARIGFDAIADEVAAVGDDRVLTAGRPEPPRLPSPRLLGAYDPLLHGWVSRRLVVGEHRGVVTTNGIFRPVALVEGRVVATWSLARGAVSIRRLEPIPSETLNALINDAADVFRFLGLHEIPVTLD
jgi:Winged helix DNA-binding domain